MLAKEPAPADKNHEIRFGGRLLQRGFWLYV